MASSARMADTEDPIVKRDHGLGSSHVGVLSSHKGAPALSPDNKEMSGCEI